MNNIDLNIKKLQQEGMSQRAIAKRLNIPKSPVHDRIKKLFPTKRIIAMFDFHYPYNIDISSISSFMEFWKPTTIIYGGDWLDLPYISKYNKEDKVNNGKTLKYECKAVHDIISVHKEISGASDIYYLEGNHELRMEKYLLKNPECNGFLNIPIILDLESLGVKWVPHNEMLQIGDLFFIHGFYYNTHHSNQHLISYNRNIVYGHTHDVQFRSGIHPYDKKEAFMAGSAGCLCNINPYYARNQPNKWVNAFYIATIEDGKHWGEVVRLDENGSFRVSGINRKFVRSNDV